MTRRSTPEPEREDAEYSEDESFLLELMAFFDAMPRSPTTVIGENGVAFQRIPPPDLKMAPSVAANLATAKERGWNIRAAVRQALRDALEMSRDWTADEVTAADQHLAARDLPTLSAMRLRVWQTISNVLARGRIRNDSEYRLIMARLDDVDGLALPAADRATLSEMARQYEARPRRGR